MNTTIDSNIDSKAKRLALIKARWNRNSRFFAATLAVANAVVAKSTIDEKDTIRRTRALTSERASSMDDSIADVDNVELTVSRLTITAPDLSEDDSNSLSSYLLTPLERQILARDWKRKGVVETDTNVQNRQDDDTLPEGFVLGVVERFVSLFDGITEPNAFEIDLADRQLALMPAPRVLLLTA